MLLEKVVFQFLRKIVTYFTINHHQNILFYIITQIMQILKKLPYINLFSATLFLPTLYRALLEPTALQTDLQSNSHHIINPVFENLYIL